MVRATTAQLLRWFLVGCGAAVLLVAVVGALGRVVTAAPVSVLLPFAALAVAGALLSPALPRVDRAVARLTRHERVSPYAALADATRRIPAGAPDDVLPGLARVLAVGTGARRAVVWFAVGDRLVEAARHPPGPSERAPALAGLGALLALPDTDHVVPVLDGNELRAALALTKPGPVTAADRRLMRDLASGAGLLLRVAALNAELALQVRRAADLAGELQASRRRLADARDGERRRLVGELAHTTDEPLAALRGLLAEARTDLAAESAADDGAADGGAAEALATARTRLDDLLDRFRLIARGVFPSVLRDQGLVSALEEVAADLPRPVLVEGTPGPRMPWEIESGVYFAVASVLRELAGHPAEPPPLAVRLERTEGRIGVRVEEPHPPVDAGELRVRLADDVDRLGALGGALELDGSPPGAAAGRFPDVPAPLVVRLWLPDRLEPVAGAAAAQVALR